MNFHHVKHLAMKVNESRSEEEQLQALQSGLKDYDSNLEATILAYFEKNMVEKKLEYLVNKYAKAHNSLEESITIL